MRTDRPSWNLDLAKLDLFVAFMGASSEAWSRVSLITQENKSDVEKKQTVISLPNVIIAWFISVIKGFVDLCRKLIFV